VGWITQFYSFPQAAPTQTNCRILSSSFGAVGPPDCCRIDSCRCVGPRSSREGTNTPGKGKSESAPRPCYNGLAA
jgi:hypothetical protein